MGEFSEFRPQTSAHTTVQPRGEQIVTPYTLEEETAWTSYVTRARVIEGLKYLDYDGLEETMRAAREEGDMEIIRLVETECRDRDRWDESDPRFNYLAGECKQTIQFLTGEPNGAE